MMTEHTNSLFDKRIWGIDMGGTKLEGVILQSAIGTESIFRNRISTEADKGYDHVVLQVKKLVDQMKQETGLTPEKIGFGTPGIRDSNTGLMKNCNSTILNGKNLKQDLESILEVEVTLANDANCFALAETKFGVVKEKYPKAEVVFGVIMGSGVGGGIVVNGKLINGHHGIAGEWGHNFLDNSGGPCYCGKTGCVETVISGTSLERFYFEKSERKKLLKDIVSDAKYGTDAFAQKTVDRLIHFFGLSLSVIINILDPDVIVVGGGVGNIDLLYAEGLKALETFTFNTRLETPVMKPMLGDSAGVFGAALLVS
jgi:fructokinase